MTTNDPRARRWLAAYAERPRLLQIARRRTASEAEAEDCVSEAVLRCVEFEGLDEERIPAFLTTVTLRLCADQHRGRARLARIGGQLVGRTEEPSPEDGVCDQAEAIWLVERLRGMSAHQRRVVAARAEGLSCDDVARRLGVSVDAVKSAVARVRGTARATLAKTLGVVPWMRRWESGAAGGVLATAVAGVTVGGVLFLPQGPAEVPRPDVDPPAAEERVAPAPRYRPAAASTRDAERPAAVRPTSTRATDPGGTVPGGGTDPRDVAITENTRLKNHDSPYSQRERLLHCVENGLNTERDIECKDPEDP